MKTSSIVLAAILGLGVASTSTDVTAQPHAQGHKKTSKRTTTKRTTKRKTSKRKRVTRRRARPRSGVSVRVGIGTGYPYHPHGYRHHHYSYSYPYHPYYRRTVVVRERPQVVIVEREPQFVMPGLECPIRTDEARSGLKQWCATSRGTKHGPYRSWYGDGVLAAEGEYAYDLKVGVWTEYHSNGAVREEGEYDDDVRVGTWITWGADGQELVSVDY